MANWIQNNCINGYSTFISIKLDYIYDISTFK